MSGSAHSPSIACQLDFVNCCVLHLASSLAARLRPYLTPRDTRSTQRTVPRPSRSGGGNRRDGHDAGQGDGRERYLGPHEPAALGDAAIPVVQTRLGICLYQRAYWHNVLAVVWGYTFGGYPVLKT
jgi:hypothetical protein